MSTLAGCNGLINALFKEIEDGGEVEKASNSIAELFIIMKKQPNEELLSKL